MNPSTPSGDLHLQFQAAQDAETANLQEAGALRQSHASVHRVEEAFSRVERARAEKNRLAHLIAAGKGGLEV